MPAHPLDDVPMHWAFGERAPQALVALLAALAVLMAGGAVWSIAARARGELQPAPPAARAQSTGVASADAAPVVAEAPRAAEATPVAAMPAVAAPAPADARPECPAALRVHFAFGSAVPVEAEASLDAAAIVDWAKSHPHAKVMVEGHADRVGPDQSNVLLSYARARAVASWLERRGLPPQRMQLTAAGNHALIEGMAPESQAQRRVVVQLSDSENCQTTAK
ncbi:MAG: OmpA family protein [Burkholderiaceae bacterium]